jgi:hypothetical protein
MKSLTCLSFISVGLVFLTLNNGAYNIPVPVEHSFYDADSAEGAGLSSSDWTESEHFLKRFTDNGNKVNGVIIDFSTQSNCTTDVSTDKKAMSNDVQIPTRTTDKNKSNNTYNKTSTIGKKYEFDKAVESIFKDLEPSYDFSDNIDEPVFEKSDGSVEDSLLDNVHYEDMPIMLIIYIINENGGAHNVEVEYADQVTSDEIALNFNWAVKALDFINNDETSSEEGMEWTEDAESEEPHRIVEDGYIFYDMGEFLFLSLIFPRSLIFHGLGKRRKSFCYILRYRLCLAFGQE